MRKRHLCCRPVSVRQSVTLVDYSHMAEDIVKLLVRSGSDIVIVFRPLATIPNSKGNPFSGDVKYTLHRGGKFLRFSSEIAMYLGNGMSGMLIGNDSWRIDLCQFG